MTQGCNKIRHSAFQPYKNVQVNLRFAQSLMALNVSLKFSLFGTRYKISSVTRQPVRKKKKKRRSETLKTVKNFTLLELLHNPHKEKVSEKTNFCYLDSNSCHNQLLQIWCTKSTFYSCIVENSTSIRPPHNINFSTLFGTQQKHCTIKAADTPNVQVSQDGVSP